MKRHRSTKQNKKNRNTTPLLLSKDLAKDCKGKKKDNSSLKKNINDIHALLTAFTAEEKRELLLQLQTIKAIVDSCSFKSLKSDEPRKVQVLDLYCLTRFESKSSSKGIVY